MSARNKLYTDVFTLHQQLLAGDPTLLADIAQLALEPLIALLRREFPDIDDHLLQEKAADALLEYGKNPAGANARSGAGVMGFLVMRGKSRVLSGIQRERRRERAEGYFAHGLRSDAIQNPVELRFVRGEHHSEGPSDTVAAPSTDPVERLDLETRVQDLLAGARSELDQEILRLMLDGVRATSDYARLLGIADRPMKEQRRIVKQHKDRLKVAGMRNQEAKRAGPKRRGRPPRRRGSEGGNGD